MPLTACICALCNSLDWDFVSHVCVEFVLISVIVWLVFHKSYRVDLTNTLTSKEIDELIADWQQEPLTPIVDPQSPLLRRPYVDGKLGKTVVINGKECLNFASMNFLGLATDSSVEDVAVKSLHRLGTGTCGPRAFYGTLDIHLTLEKWLADFMQCEEAILYSYGFAAVASALPAYCKRGDVIFADRNVNFAIQKGLQASRSRIEFFNHNDMADLENLLLQQREKDVLNPKKARVTRRFIVVEGIYLYSGDICPLPELIKLKWKYKVRLFLDESVAFGVLGKTGRGAIEHYDANIADVDLICCSLELSAAGTGGFCCGRTFIVDHQRLAGAGYCYSASLPSPLTAALIRSLEIIKDEPERIERLRHNCQYLYNQLNGLKRFRFTGSPESPLFHLRPAGPEDADFLDDVVEKAIQNDSVLLTKMAVIREQEMFNVPESIKLAVSSEHTLQDIDRLVLSLQAFEQSGGFGKTTSY